MPLTGFLCIYYICQVLCIYYICQIFVHILHMSGTDRQIKIGDAMADVVVFRKWQGGECSKVMILVTPLVI